LAVGTIDAALRMLDREEGEARTSGGRLFLGDSRIGESIVFNLARMDTLVGLKKLASYEGPGNKQIHRTRAETCDIILGYSYLTYALASSRPTREPISIKWSLHEKGSHDQFVMIFVALPITV